jgi:hypothetical protein
VLRAELKESKDKQKVILLPVLILVVKRQTKIPSKNRENDGEAQEKSRG